MSTSHVTFTASVLQERGESLIQALGWKVFLWISWQSSGIGVADTEVTLLVFISVPMETKSHLVPK